MLLVVFVFILILAFFFGDAGIIDIMKSRNKIEQLQKEIDSLKKQKEDLIKEIQYLEKNPEALERKAREKLWLMKKNEKVVVIVKDKKKEDENHQPHQEYP